MRSDSMPSFRNVLLVAVILQIASIESVAAPPSQIQVVHSFSGKPDDGRNPDTGVRFDNAGNLYGTTSRGGAYDGGTIYKIASDGTESVLYSFSGVGQTQRPISPMGVVTDPETGDVYGSTQFGGDVANCFNGCGEIYKLAADGTFVVLHAFNSQDGDLASRLVRDSQGNLYGTNELGGSGNGGTVFEYRADGTFIVRYAFSFRSSSNRPLGPVVPDDAGNLYGITKFYNGPLSSGGSIYELSPDGTFTVLYVFSLPYVPMSLVRNDSGNLYGTAVSEHDGSYMAFEFTLDGTFTPLHLFPPVSLGVASSVNVLLPVAGKLYGTGYGISGYTGGTLFEIAANGKYSVLSRFTNGTGVMPTDRLTLWSGRLYGGAVSGGADDDGTIFSLDVSN